MTLTDWGRCPQCGTVQLSLLATVAEREKEINGLKKICSDYYERMRAEYKADAIGLSGAVVRAEAAQAKVDALMLEHCPDEMTPEQKATWAAAQEAVPGSEPTTALEKRVVAAAVDDYDIASTLSSHNLLSAIRAYLGGRQPLHTRTPE